jgi:hypothetical protein
VIIVLGLLVSVAGSGTKDLVEPRFRWVQLVVGVALIGLAALHFTGKSSRLAFFGRVTALGGRAWDAAVGRASTRSSFLWGAGFVAIGAG